jgi:hypothetical protein
MQSAMDNQVSEGATGLAKVPASVWILGSVSMLMDVSSEMIHALLPARWVSHSAQNAPCVESCCGATVGYRHEARPLPPMTVHGTRLKIFGRLNIAATDVGTAVQRLRQLLGLDLPRVRRCWTGGS